jgi:hypothetical protein
MVWQQLFSGKRSLTAPLALTLPFFYNSYQH